jgi:glucokinase
VTNREQPASSPPPTCCIGVDVGGSHIAAVVTSPDGASVWRGEQPLDCGAPDGERCLERLLAILDEALQQVPGGCGVVIGVGAPGLIDYRRGIVLDAHAVGWAPLALKPALEERYGLPVLIENDVNLATLGEARIGAGKGLDNVVCMFIGTNIGGGVVINGQLYRGAHGGAGEIGWMVPEPALLKRAHLVDGCLEAYAGGLGIAQRARQAVSVGAGRGSAMLETTCGEAEAIRAEHVFAAALQGDAVAAAVLEQVYDYLAVATANIICLLDPEMIVIGGGVARAGDMIISAVRQRIAGLSVHQPVLALSRLGQDAVLLGALALCREYGDSAT